MRKLWSFVVLAAFSVVASTSFAQDSASSGSLNQLSESEKGDGWKLLFDGKTTDGWRNYKKEGVNDQWKVEDGALTLTGKGAAIS